MAVLILAGGQGSRLGFDHQKGMFPMDDLCSRKTLFQLLVEQFARACVDALDFDSYQDFRDLYLANEHAKMPAKMIIMCSIENCDETKQYFRDNKWFGLPEHTFKFIV